MRGINKVILIGRVGQDPEIRATAGGKLIAHFSVATHEQWSDKVSGERQEQTEWHRIVAFGHLAELVQRFIKKGSTLYLEGKLQTRSWSDREGQKRQTTEIQMTQMELLDPRSREDEISSTPPREESRRDRSPPPEESLSPYDDSIPF